MELVKACRQRCGAKLVVRCWSLYLSRKRQSGPMRLSCDPGRVSMSASTQRGYEVVDFPSMAGVPCPCGTSRRGLADVEDFPGTVHMVEISENARTHYHKRLTETYVVLECEADAKLQLDDEQIALHPGMCVMIRPGTRHRAIGRMRILNIVFPKFDPADEWFD